jgi:hypothetical protein
VLAVTVECDEKIALYETGAIRPDNHNLGDGGSDTGHFSKSVRSGAPLVISLQSFKPALCFPG